MRHAFIEALIELAASDDRVVLLTADVGFSFLEPFRNRFPSRFFNVGVAEPNLIGLATGLAEDGLVPFAYTMAAFALPRTFEVVRNGPVAHALPIRIVGVGGGFDYGVNGASHYALEDLALARALGEIDIVVPADGRLARDALFATRDRPGPVYLRLGNENRGVLPVPAKATAPGSLLRLGAGGSDVRIVALGPAAFDALVAADALAPAGIEVDVLVAQNLRPLDLEDFTQALRGARLVVTLENHRVEGGLGSVVAEILVEAEIASRLLRLGVASRNFPPGSPAYLRTHLGLDGPSVARRIREALPLG